MSSHRAIFLAKLSSPKWGPRVAFERRNPEASEVGLSWQVAHRDPKQSWVDILNHVICLHSHFRVAYEDRFVFMLHLEGRYLQASTTREYGLRKGSHVEHGFWHHQESYPKACRTKICAKRASTSLRERAFHSLANLLPRTREYSWGAGICEKAGHERN